VKSEDITLKANNPINLKGTENRETGNCLIDLASSERRRFRTTSNPIILFERDAQMYALAILAAYQLHE
jgi:hypothetical protein